MSIQEAKTSDFTLEKSEVLPLTPEFAEQFRDMEPSPTERPLNPSRVEHLREKALAGLLVPFTWSVAKFGDKMVRMNGQHSSTMLCALNGAFPKDGKVHLDTYRVESPEGLALLFRQFDDRKSGRTPSDVAAAYQGIHSELKEVPRPTAKLAAEGINWYHRYVEGVPSLSGDDIYNLFGDANLHPFVHWLGELFTIKTPELKRQPIVAAMFGTFVKNETEARKFWADVARGGAEFDDSAPATLLDAWLKTAAETRGNRRELKPGNFYQGCIFAWNAYREAKPISSIKFDARKGLHKIAE
jgi:hypothetical protein